MSGSGKLDQSLDQILKDRPAGPKRGRAGRLPARKAATKSKAATTAVIAPAGGVRKNIKTARPAATPAAVAALTGSGESKISVSNLPDDVDEKMIKDYFGSLVAPVKRVIVNYGPTGRSRGSATVFFSKPTAAAAAAKHDGTKVDGRAMRIEVLMGASAITPARAPKSLQDRVSGPKNAAKENEKKKNKPKQDAPKPATADAAGKAGRNGKKKSGRVGKPKAKTAEELDAEMQDYFGSGEAPATNGGAQPAGAAVAATGDTGMVDEVM